jgi:hypothetical protein
MGGPRDLGSPTHSKNDDEYSTYTLKILRSIAIDALNKFNEHIFPKIFKLLTILCMLPLSVTTDERSFSTLKRVKIWFCLKSQEHRLTSLCLLNIHRDKELNVSLIIDRFNKKCTNRHIDFVTYLISACYFIYKQMYDGFC